MNRALLLRTIGCLAVLAPACSAHLPHVRRVSKGDPPLANVIYYALPRTVVTVRAVVRREETEAGRCSTAADAAWLARRLGPKMSPKRNGLRYELHDWKLATRSEPDPDNVFAMTVSADTFDDHNQAIELTEHGVLVADTVEGSAVGPEFLSAALELGGSLVAKALPLLKMAATDERAFGDEFCKDAKKRVEDMDAAEAKLVGDAVGDAAKRANLELMLKEVRGTRDQLLLHFTGRVVDKNDYGVQCELTPVALPATGKAPEQVVTLFSFDPKAGVVAAEGVRCAMAGEVVAEMAGGRPIRARVRPAAGFAVAVRDSAEAAEKVPAREPSLFYRPASPATILIEDGASVVMSSVETIAQLGPVLWLPGDGDLGAWRAKYEIALHPNTGALKKVAMSVSGATPKPLGSAVTAAGSVLDAVKARQDRGQAAAAAAKAAPLEALERERKILEEQQKIDKLKSGGTGE